MNKLEWYVVQTQPRMERMVRERIADFGREVFLPLVSERSAGRPRMSLVPLFPSYLFARLSEGSGDLGRVRWSHGVRKLLGNGPTPTPLDERIVDAIRARADRGGKVRLGATLRRGERVQVLNGPFAGLTGILERGPTTPAERVYVLLDVFQRATRVVLRTGDIAGLSRI